MQGSNLLGSLLPNAVRHEGSHACETRALPARSMRASMSVRRTVSSVCTRSATPCNAAGSAPHKAIPTA